MYQGYKEVLVEKLDAVLAIKFYNPKKKNCVNRGAYGEIGRALREVAKDETVTVVVLTGVGEFFTAGNDLSASANITDLDAYIKESSTTFREMISAMIDCPKVVIALVNGPCIGIGTTLAALSDMLWCADTAYFSTPFTKLGLVPEGCSSYLLPLLVGRSKTTEMLLFGEQLTAAEAYRYHFASKVFKHSEINTEIWPKIMEYSRMPPGAVQVSKQLIRLHERDSLYKALDAECEELNKRFYTEEFMNAMLQFAMRKNKAKL